MVPCIDSYCICSHSSSTRSNGEPQRAITSAASSASRGRFGDRGPAHARGRLGRENRLEDREPELVRIVVDGIERAPGGRPGQTFACRRRHKRRLSGPDGSDDQRHPRVGPGGPGRRPEPSQEMIAANQPARGGRYSELGSAECELERLRRGPSIRRQCDYHAAFSLVFCGTRTVFVQAACPNITRNE